MQSFFVSSTFKDMQGERDALHKIVLPRLRDKAKGYGQNVQFVDLRWGISTEDMDSDEGAAKIMEVCLDEIDDCKPYMIILLGERYGWMPDVSLIQKTIDKKRVPIECRPMSITEMEIQYGMLMNSGNLDHCVFCIRNPLPVQDMPEDVLKDMVCQTEEEKYRLEMLKKHIRETKGVHVFEYNLTWDEEKKELAGYDAFADALSDTLEQLMLDEWGEASQMSWQERQMFDDDLLKDTLLGCFYGREKEIEASIKRLGDTQIYVLEAEGGSGKSAFISAMAQKIPRSHVIYCGNSSNCTTVEQLLQILCWRVGICQGTEAPESNSLEKWRDMWNSYVAVQAMYPETFFIDAIDQLYGDDALFQSLFVPVNMPDNIRIVITTTGSVRVNPSALVGKKYIQENLFAPSDADRLRIIQEMLRAEHKQVSSEVESAILQNPCSKNMLALSMMVRRLTMLGEKDFKEITQLEATMSGDAAIRTYLLNLVKEFPTNIYRMMDDYLVAVCEYLNAGIEGHNNRIILYLIACTETGLSKADLESMQEFIRADGYLSKNEAWSTFWNELKFSRMKYFLGSLLVEKSDGKIDFTHRLLREGIRTNYSIKHCCYVLLYTLFCDKTKEQLKYENVIPIGRQVMSIEKNDGESLSNTAEKYIVPAVREAGNQSEDDDPKVAKRGEEKLNVLIRSVLMDIGKHQGQRTLDIYCEMLRSVIDAGRGPRAWLIWLFENKIVADLWNQGDIGKTKAIQILLAILSLYMAKDKKTYRESLNEKESRALCGMFMEAYRLYKLLYSSIEHARISGRDYDYTFDVLYKDGKEWIEQHLQKYPEDLVVINHQICFHFDQAYMASEIFGSTKDVKKAEDGLKRYKALMSISDLSRIHTYIYRNIEMARLYIKMHRNAIIHGKKYLAKAQEKMDEAKMYFTILPEHERPVLLELRFYTMLAVVYDKINRTREGLEVLWQCYCRIEEKHPDFNANERSTYSELIMCLVRLLYKYKNVHVGGKGKYLIAKELIKHEAGYIRANVNENFASRYHLAEILFLQMDCKQHELSGDYEKEKREAIIILRQLSAEQKKSNRGIDTWKYNAEWLLGIIENF